MIESCCKAIKMATSLIDFDVDPRSAEKINDAGTCQNHEVGNLLDIDSAIEHQLNELINFKHKSTNSSSTTTCLLDLDDYASVDKCEPIQQKGNVDFMNSQPVSERVTSDELVSAGSPVTRKDEKSENTSTNVGEFPARELRKSAFVISMIDDDATAPTKEKELIIVYSNPISWMFEYASKMKLKNPVFVKEEVECGFKVTCSFVGVKGEASGRNLKSTRTQSAEECLKNFHAAILSKDQSINVDSFRIQPPIVDVEFTMDQPPKNAVGKLYEHAAKWQNARPQFDCCEVKGQKSSFTVTCSYLCHRASSTNTVKQRAKMEAALKVYEKLVNAQHSMLVDTKRL
ncbi:uncharacterized protein LOC111049052 isoform X2 [Nilaparvata lugens]|nr:uncharacterized protein LOC111049052 isoform X2 [Nilaparvata lugens]